MNISVVTTSLNKDYSANRHYKDLTLLDLARNDSEETDNNKLKEYVHYDANYSNSHLVVDRFSNNHSNEFDQSFNTRLSEPKISARLNIEND